MDQVQPVLNQATPKGRTDYFKYSSLCFYILGFFQILILSMVTIRTYGNIWRGATYLLAFLPAIYFVLAIALSKRKMWAVYAGIPVAIWEIINTIVGIVQAGPGFKEGVEFIIFMMLLYFFWKLKKNERPVTAV